MRKRYLTSVTVVLLLAAAALPTMYARVDVKPGFNSFSPQQDIELGQEAAKQVSQQYQLITDPQVNDYINRLGHRLASYAPGYKFPYAFHVVLQKQINAFALPGGNVYVNSATIIAAQNEAQLAGVMAHEISHVALRHSTNQASKAMLAQAPLAILGGVLSGSGIGGQLAQLGIAFGVNSAFLKFSRSAESQADTLGSQIMYDAGYNPINLAQFFQTIEKQGSSQSLEFLSDHPNPGNRIENVDKLIPKLGPAKTFTSGNESEFEQVKRRVVQLQASAPNTPSRRSSSQTPPPPSRNTRTFQSDYFSLNYPDNWQAYGAGAGTVTIAPHEGIGEDQQGGPREISYGAISSIYEDADRNQTISSATSRLISDLQQSNPHLHVISNSSRNQRVDGQDGYSVTALGQSAVGGEEMNWVVTSFRPEGLWYIVFIAPEQAWNTYQPIFQQMLSSVRFPR